MKKKILVGIIIVSFIASLVVAYDRLRVEQSSPNVEIVLDWITFEEFQGVMKEPPMQLLQKFRDAGVTSVAIFEKTLKDYVKSNDLAIYYGKDLVSQYYFSSGANRGIIGTLYQGSSDLDNIYLLFNTPELYNKLRHQIEAFPGDFVQDVYEDPEKGIYILELENEQGKLETMPLGFSSEEIAMVSSLGLKVVPRVSDSRERLYGLAGTLKDLHDRLEISQVIFSGTQVTGYPNKLKETATIINDLDIKVGMIEPFIAYQQGIKELAPMVDMNIVRVHSIKTAEMTKYSYTKVLDRYIRAVKERNVRVLYYKPFLSPKIGLNPMALNTKFVKDLETGLTKNGYRIGIAEPFIAEQTDFFWILLIALGVYAAGLLLLDRLIVLPVWLSFGLLFFAVPATALLMLKGYVLLTRDLLALLAAIVLPSLAILWGYEQSEDLTASKGEVRQALRVFFQVTGITLVGVCFVIGLLSDVRYLYQVNQFRGIKFTFILPLVILTVYYLKRFFDAEGAKGYVRVIKEGLGLLNQPVRYIHLVLIGLIGMAGLIYIGRTGNNPILPVPAWELLVREWLEDIFVYRPRFKELMGHPFLILAFYYLLSQKKKWIYPVMVLGAIGQLTIINTFSHIHTPLLASGVRVFIGVILGMVGGLILIWVYRKVETHWNQYWRRSYE